MNYELSIVRKGKKEKELNDPINGLRETKVYTGVHCGEERFLTIKAPSRNSRCWKQRGGGRKSMAGGQDYSTGTSGV
jgi:hypothetical protein